MLQGDVINSFNYTDSDNADATGHGYVTCVILIVIMDSLIGMVLLLIGSYSLGSTFGSFMNRRYPSD